MIVGIRNGKKEWEKKKNHYYYRLFMWIHECEIEREREIGGLRERKGKDNELGFVWLKK